MIDQLRLSEAEWTLMVELLERELSDLPVEIHHSRVASMREELSARRDLVRGLLDRLRPAMVA